MSSSGVGHGGVAQLARANGSYPLGRWFEPTRRYHLGPLVKRLRHRPFTAVTRVQISYGSPYGSIAQLGEHLPYKQRVIGSSPIVPTKKSTSTVSACRFLLITFSIFTSALFTTTDCLFTESNGGRKAFALIDK